MPILAVCFTIIGIRFVLFVLLMFSVSDGGSLQQQRWSSWLWCLKEGGGERERVSVWPTPGQLILMPHCLSSTQGQWTLGPPCQLPGSLLGYGSGPPTTSHVRPSVPLCTAPSPACPAYHNTALQDEAQSRARDTAVSPKPLLFWWNYASADAKK